MSAINGDKARFNRDRKKRIARRKQTQAMLSRAAGPKPPAASAHGEAKPVKS